MENGVAVNVEQKMTQGTTPIRAMTMPRTYESGDFSAALCGSRACTSQRPWRPAATPPPAERPLRLVDEDERPCRDEQHADEKQEDLHGGYPPSLRRAAPEFGALLRQGALLPQPRRWSTIARSGPPSMRLDMRKTQSAASALSVVIAIGCGSAEN